MGVSEFHNVILRYFSIGTVVISVSLIILTTIYLYVNYGEYVYLLTIYDPLSMTYLTFGLTISLLLAYLLSKLFRLYVYVIERKDYRYHFYTILYFIEAFIALTILDELFPLLSFSLLRIAHFILLASSLTFFIMRFESINYNISSLFAKSSKSLGVGGYTRLIHDFSASLIIFWASFSLAVLWGIPIFTGIYVAIVGRGFLDYFLLLTIIALAFASLVILLKMKRELDLGIGLRITIFLSIVMAIVLSKILFFNVYAAIYLKSIEVLSFMISIMYFSIAIDRIIYILPLTSRYVADISLKEPKIVLIEFSLKLFGSNKIPLAKALMDKLCDPMEIGRDLMDFDTIIIYTIRGSPLIEYLETNLIHYLIDESGRQTTPIYTITLTRSLTLPKLYSVGKGIWRYEVGIDPTYTPYIIDRVRKEVNSKSVLVIIENPVDLVNLTSFKRFYELLHSIVERLKANDMLIVLVPLDLVDEKMLNALRNIAAKIVSLYPS